VALRGDVELDRVVAEETARKFKSRTEEPWVSLDSQIDLLDPRSVGDAPGSTGNWKVDQKLQLPVTGAVFLFGQLGAGDNFAAAQDMKVSSRSGVGCKVPLLAGSELQLRSGPEVTCSDPLQPMHLQEKSLLYVEMQCKCPLMGLAGLDFVG